MASECSVNGEVLSKPTSRLNNNIVLVHTSRGMFWIALDSRERCKQKLGQLVLKFLSLTLRGESSPATVSGGVFWGTANGRLAAAIVDSRSAYLATAYWCTPKGATEIDRLVDVDSSPSHSWW